MFTRRRLLGLGIGASVSASVASRAYTLFAQTNPPIPQVSAQALAIHQRALVFDGHVHALDREFYHGGSMGSRYSDGLWDLPRAREGGVGAFLCSVFIPEEYYPGRFETKQAFRRIDHALLQLEMNRDQVQLALNAGDIERIRAKGKIAAVLDIEGSYDLDGDLGVLRDLYRLGVRSAQLSAHNWNQNYADSCCAPPQWNGLTDHGREVIHEMNRLGMLINVSHSADDTILQAIDASDQPVVATHHGLRSVVNIPRNMPDDVLKKLASKGGVMGLWSGTQFNDPKSFAQSASRMKGQARTPASVAETVKDKTIDEIDRLVAPTYPMHGAPDSSTMTVDDWVAVVDKVIQLVGEDHIALGSDFDGGPSLPRPMRDVRDLPQITDAMLRRGYSEERIDKFWGGNLLRVFRQVTQNRA